MPTKSSGPISIKWTEKVTENKKEVTKTRETKVKLSVEYTIADRTIKIIPKIIVSNYEFKNNVTATIKWTYQKLDKSSNSKTEYDNDYDKVTTTKTISKIKDKKTYSLSEQTIQSYDIDIRASISGSYKNAKGTKVTISKSLPLVEITADNEKPPKPIAIYYHDSQGNEYDGVEYGRVGIYHLVKDQLDWWLCFKYVPKDGKPDYNNPVSKYVIEQTTSVNPKSWTTISTKNTEKDVNGFEQQFQYRIPYTLGERYQWRIRFYNAISQKYSNSLLLPPNDSTDWVKDSKGNRIPEDVDYFKEWAYSYPKSIDIAAIQKTDNGARITWNREIQDANDGKIRGYFVQYQKNEGIGDNKKWNYLLDGRKSEGMSLYVIKKESYTNTSTLQYSLNIPCDTNSQYRFKLVTFNFHLGTIPDYNYRNDNPPSNGWPESFIVDVTPFDMLAPDLYGMQCTPSSNPTEKVYFTPAPADNVTAVKNSNDLIDVKIEYKTASWGSVNAVRIYRQYIFTEGDPGEWNICYDTEGQSPMDPDVGIEIRNYESQYTYTDRQPVPTTVIVSGVQKTVEGVNYKVQLGAVYEVDPYNPLAPIGEAKWSTETLSSNSASSLSKPNPPGLLFPEKNKCISEDTNYIYFSWVHNPTDYTDQTQAKLDVFIFEDGVTVPEDFFTSYIGSIPETTKNEVTITGDSSFYNLDLSQTTVTKITSVNTSSHTVSYRENLHFSANDTILWRVQTKGTYSEPSEFTTEYRPVKIVGPPEIALSIPSLSSDGIIETIPVKVYWDYTDRSGMLSRLILYLREGNSIVESYVVDVNETSGSYSFEYLFENHQSYSIIAEAVSTTSLSATDESFFKIEYVTTILKQQLAVDAAFNEHTGASVVTLSEITNEGTESDSAPIEIQEGSTTVTRQGSKIDMYYTINDYDSGRFVVKVLLNKPLAGITLAAGTEGISHLYPRNTLYPGSSNIPIYSIVTDDERTSYQVYSDYPDREGTTFKLYFLAEENRGEFEYLDNGEPVRVNPLEITIFSSTPGDYPDIKYPIKAVLYTEFDELDQPEEQPYIDMVATDSYLYRYYRGERTLIGHFTPDYQDDEVVTSTIEDRFCPINNEFQYQLIQLTAEINGVRHISYSEFTYKFDSLYWYAYWGAGYRNVAKARWNPTGSVTYSRPEQQQVRYSGRRFPVVYDSDAMEESYSLNIDLFEDEYMQDNLEDDETALETISRYRQLMFDGGTGFWKSFTGDVYFAVFNFDYSEDFTDGIKKYPCSLKVTRIEGDEVF